jgi:mRNA degradation ribonuclease J1/J2
MEIQILGGARTVGGNRILVKFNDQHIWFDMGVTYKYKLELPEYNIIRGFSLKRLLSEGLFPSEALAESVKKEQGKRYINVLISHAHSDHYALITYFRAWYEAKINLRLYAPPDAYRTLQARLELGNLRRALTNIDYRTLEEAEAEGFEIRPVNVDHSMDASYGYVVETPLNRIGYTGDFRFTTRKDFDKMLKGFEGVDSLVCEATRVVSHGLETENDVRVQVENLMNRFFNSTVIFIVGWYTYTRRVKTIIASSAGRKVVLHSKIAHMIQAADPDVLKNPKVFVLQHKLEKKIPEKYKTISLEDVNAEH